MISLRQNNFCKLIVFLLVVCSFQRARAQETIHLFPDRSYAVSGDTVWFVVSVHSENTAERSGVVHIQLDNLANHHITKVSVQCIGNTGKGYIYIPDSLSTGVYLLRPYSLLQKNSGREVVHQSLLTVYNRFDNKISWIEKPEHANFNRYASNNEIGISTNKKQYQKGERVNVSINISEAQTVEIEKVFITAGLADPFSSEYLTGWIPSEKIVATKSAEKLVEKNGVLIAGKVRSGRNSQPVPNATVILSIPDSIPFFDYSISDSAGAFYFYLRNATGTADLVIQALSENTADCKIELFENFIDAGTIEYSRHVFAPGETEFADNAIDAGYYKKLFNGYQGSSAANFKMPLQFEYPFYGEPSKTFDPGLFIDLPGFQEISREILTGVQYRERKNDTTIRLADYGANSVFSRQPLILLDGIPVFDTGIITPLGTQTIDEVDVVYYKRYFGDLAFHGVLAIYTKQPSLNWVDLHPRITHFKYPCIQPPQEFYFKNKSEESSTIPNLSKVLYRQIISEIEPQFGFDFITSDIKGTISINVICIDKDNHISAAQMEFEVK